MDPDHPSISVKVFAVLFFLMAGVWLTYFPKSVRKQALGKKTGGLFYSAMQNELYVHMLRAGSAVAFIASGLLLGVMFFH